MSSSAPQYQFSEENHSLKEKIQHPFPHLREKLKETHLYDVKIKATHMKHKVGKFGNLFNRNHRHDEEHEKKTDEKRSMICENHRFNSFAPERYGNEIKWYVDGRDYFWVRSCIRWDDPGKWLMGCVGRVGCTRWSQGDDIHRGLVAFPGARTCVRTASVTRTDGLVSSPPPLL